ncbi:putative imidazolonepropionase [Holothuria leucospilota]|uniref:Probable imidazolonepropionase n=1 Tax=Holothuria leucospilota TaxID=206669 RepID=A0A9Q1CJA7_HOLLE|nr:putative imidazolonepropionase [Holothuria leucospilota]
METQLKLLIKNARQVVQVCSKGEKILVGPAMRKLAILNETNEEGISIVVNRQGSISAIDTHSKIMKNFSHCSFDHVIDATGKCILPGLIDGHTHPVWAGDRVHEFAMKLAGASYEEIHQAGGGIHFTTEKTRAASEDELLASFKDRLMSMLRYGTTTVECKSGYGLDTDSEIKMLRVIERARKEVPIEISSTFCGAHAVPKGSSVKQATEDVLNNQLPAVLLLNQTGELQVENIDVFCEKGVFDCDQTKQILEAGVKGGLAINFHAEELNYLGSAEIGADLNARAMSHLEKISDAGITAMAKSGSVAVMLPNTAYILRLVPPPVRKMIEAGVPIALGTDFNPNAFCLSMVVTMHFACVILRMSMEESLVAATINAAASIGRAETHGSLEVSKFADMIVADVTRWEHLIYQLGSSDQLIQHVIKKGEIVHSRPS